MFQATASVLGCLLPSRAAVAIAIPPHLITSAASAAQHLRCSAEKDLEHEVDALKRAMLLPLTSQ